MNAKMWLAAFASELDSEPPSPEEFRVLLDLAGEAAHRSERVAAPVACWVAARSGVTPERALAAARGIGERDDG